MNPKDLLLLLGRYDTDPLVEAALRHYRVRNRPAVEIDDEDVDGPVVGTQSWVKNSRAGIEFGFHDEAAWIGLDETEFGKRPMLLTQIYLYGQHEGVRPYQEPLPFDLQISDDRVTVRKKFAGLESTRHSHVRDTWDAPECRLTVAYTAAHRSIDFVLCMLREPALPALDYALQPVPSIENLVAILGCPLSAPAVRQAFDPLGLQDRIDEVKETGEADFLNPYGIVLIFVPPADAAGRTSSEPLLSAVTLYQERELGSRLWPGELPFGLRFDDSPETAVVKVGRPPDEQYDESFSGHAVWFEPAFTLRLFYNTMENRIARVILIAPELYEK